MHIYYYTRDLHVLIHILFHAYKCNFKYHEILKNMFVYEFPSIIVVKLTRNQVPGYESISPLRV